MATTLDIEIFKMKDAGNFWARPIGCHGEEIQNVLGKLNDFLWNNSAPQLQPKKGQMCIIQRTSDNCWYRARIKNVLQTLSGPQASVFLVDLAETTLVPCCRIRETPEGFQTIPVQAMECSLAGLRPLGLVTSYFDLKTSKQVTDHWDEAATAFFKTLVQGSKLQITVQKQDDKGRYHVLLLADSSGHAQVCINDELVLKGFAVYFCSGATMSGVTTPEISPGVVAKLQAMNEKFQKQGSEVIKNLKEYVSFGKQTSSEESSGTDDELSDYRKHKHLYFDNSPLSILRRHLPEYNSHGPEHNSHGPERNSHGPEYNSYGPERNSRGPEYNYHGPEHNSQGPEYNYYGPERNSRCPEYNYHSPEHNSHGPSQGLLQEPAARIPNDPLSFRLSPPKLVSEEPSGSDSGKEPPYRRPPSLSTDEACGRVRFVSARLPSTGSSGVSTGLSPSSDSKPLKPILKRTSPSSGVQSSGSSTEPEDRPQDQQVKIEDNAFAYPCKAGLPRTLGDDSFQGERFLVENRQNCASGNSVSTDLFFGDLKQDTLKLSSYSNFSSNMIGETATRSDILQLEPSQANRPKSVVSLIESLRDASLERQELPSPDFSQVAGRNRTCSASQRTSAIINGPSATAIEKADARSRLSVAKSLSDKEPHKTVTSSPRLSSLKPPLPSDLFCVDSLAHSSPGATNVSFFDGFVVESEGAPAPRPTTSIENCPFSEYLRRLGVSAPSLIQAHTWPALRRGRDVVGISPSNSGRTLAYLLPIINQILEEKQMYAELPSGNGPLLLIMVPNSNAGVEVYQQCTDILARHRKVRVQVIFAGGAEESQILTLLNGCEILISTPPCFLRMLKRSYTSFNRLCHVVFDDADIMVEDFTLEIREIMRLYAKVLKSQLCRLAPRQAVVMAASWTVGVASLVKAYLGNPVSVIANMIEAAIYKNVQQIATVCSASQRDVQLLGYLESFSNTKDICIITSTTREADKIEELLEANAYYTLVAHEFLQPQELARVNRQWNTPHAADTMPVLVLTDGVLSQMNIRNASCVIHYSLPSTKTKFGQRFSVLTATFTSSKDHGCISIILVTERRFRESPFIGQLIRRSGQEVPSLLEEMAEIAIQDRVKKMKDLCHSLKAFGSCRYKRGTTNCYSRHSVIASLDKPLVGIPTSGVVKVLILCVMDASCYWVRLLEHRLTDQCQSSEVTDGTKFLELTMAVSGWFSDPKHRVKHELVSVGNLCAVQDGSSFHRVKVCYITENDSGKPLRVEVHYVDRGDFQVVHVDKLLQLPPEFHSCPFQAIQVFLCKVQPLDKDLMWTDQASFFVRRLIEGKEMEGRVVLSLGNTLWLDPLVERVHLMSINMTTNVSNVRMELLKERYAAENKQHVKLLKSLCENVIELPSLEPERIGTGDSSSKCSHALETAILAEDRFQDVYVSAVENPGLFFVQLSSSEKSLEDLRAKIDFCVANVDKEACEISVGSLCVAQFTQDDKWYRARVLGSRPENEYDVFYVDFGDREWIPGGRILPAWSNILQAPLQAIECSLVNVVPLESDWKEEDSDAFWEMVSEKRLVAKVKSKCSSLVAGCNRFIVELYDTTTQHDIILSHEVVATGHAQTSPEGLQILFPQPVSPDGGQHDYQYPFHRIPRMCLEAHQCQDLAKKVEIVKELQSVVLNSEGEKDAIRECGGVQGLCRLLSFSRTPLVQQHILASLASLTFENESNCDEVRMYGGLRTMCYLLEKTQNSALQDSLAWALKNLAISERNQDETREQGGVKCLCELLLATSDEKVQARVAWALGSLVKDNDRNCQAVEQCGGLRTLCDLVAKLQNEDALERTTWALAVLGAVPRNRNFIRQYGGIENICKKLQGSSSEQFVKQGALTLKIMASNNQSNKEAICRLRMVETLRNLMADNTPRLGIISRRVCWDLLQRLLGPAAGPAHLLSPPLSSVNGTHGCASSTDGRENNQELLAETLNGFAESDEDLPPLEGDDSETENPTDIVVSDSQQSVHRCNSRDDVQTRTSANASAVGSVCNVVSNGHRSPPVSEIEVVEPFSVHPTTVWSQTRYLVRVCVKLRGVEKAQSDITDERVVFRTQMGRTLYELDLELFQNVNAERSRMSVKGFEVQILLWKRNHAAWPRLLRTKEKLPYVSIDFDRWEVWSSSEEDEGNDDNPNANNRPRPTAANSTRTSRGSETRTESKRVLLPEMLSSSSESSKSDDERMDSDVDCLKFY